VVERICVLCSEPFAPKTNRSRFCSKKCEKAYYNARPGSECSVDGCVRPVRAKGLCGSDYNRIHQPNRHRVEFACACCGSLHVTKRMNGKYCSHECYIYATYGAAKCDLQVGTCVQCNQPFALQFSLDGHCSFACQELTRVTAAEAERLRKLAAMRAGECTACGTAFRTNQPMMVTCSDRCANRMARIRRRVREAGSYGEFRWADFMRIAAKFDYTCAYCERPPLAGESLEPDHVVPLSKGGPNTVANLLPSCHSCNSGKRDRTLTEWAAFRESRGKPPRKTSWAVCDERYHHLTALVAAA
jgi:predicted nucleic acid-binding Zn ribbon protein